MISQIEKYTKNQLVVLHGIPNPLPRKQDLLTLYNKAFDLKDDNALSILVNKYGIDRMLFTNELPGVSEKEVDRVIEDIDNFIQTINPNVNRDCFKSKTNRRLMNDRYLKYMDYSGKKPRLNTRDYLKDVPRYSLESTVYHFGISGYKKMSDKELIDAILKNDKCKDIVINLIKKKHGIYFKQYVIEYLQSGEYLINR